MRRILLILLGLLTATTAAAQQDTPSPPTAGERFFLRLPDGWVEAARDRVQGGDLVAYVPAGQNIDRWTEMLTVQMFRGMTALPASSFYERTRRNYREACDGARAGDLQTGMSNGYTSAFWVLGCGRNRTTGVGETAFFRIIQGEDALYMAQHTWRTRPYGPAEPPPVPPQAQQTALESLQSFGVCDPATAAHPCP